MNFSKKDFWSRAANKIYTMISTRLKEKTYGSDANRVKYIYFKRSKKKSGKDILAVCFPAFAGAGAKYNYVRTLNNYDMHKLFLLDDIGGVDKGNYLIKKGVEENVKEIIGRLIIKYNPSKILFFGSSKGGYSALYYSFDFENVDVCIAAPQYFLADYLIKENKIENLKIMLDGNLSEKEKCKLNYKLRDKILNSSNLPNKVFIHYSKNEHTFSEHIVDMLADLRSRGIEIEEDIEEYVDHKDLVYYFPKYLKLTLNHMLN